MKLFKISQEQNTDWDTYDSAVVAAPTKNVARKMHPDGRGTDFSGRTWACSPEYVAVECLGTAKRGTKQGVICASFNAG